ncbi:MAG: FMN-binding protein [Planctomycetes bacterium]|nr:FMN-binding protein [Planctomycetota bacterium]
MRDKPWFAVAYMFVVTAFFSSIVIGFARFTSARVKANEQLAFETAMLEAFALAEGKTGLDIHEFFLERFTKPDKESGLAYTLTEDGNLSGYAVLVGGKGFWAPIKGIVGVSADGNRIRGVSFYEQSETPGLGAEITKAQFRNQFAGRRLATTDRPIRIRPTGSKLADNEVHAITGATQTCTRLEKLINEDLARWRDEHFSSGGNQ